MARTRARTCIMSVEAARVHFTGPFYRACQHADRIIGHNDIVLGERWDRTRSLVPINVLEYFEVGVG